MSDAVSDRSDRRRELLRARLRAEGFKQESADQAADTQVGDSGTVTDQRILGRLIANAGAAGMLTWAFPVPEDAATQARIRDAIIAVAQHRPDLRTTVSADNTDGLQRTVLTADTVVTPSSDSTEPTEVDALAATPIDPTSEPPLRARFLHTPDGTMLVVSTHHVAADEHTWVLLLRDINAEIASPGVLSAQPTPPRSDATTAQVATATERRLAAVRPATHNADGEATPQPDPFAAERTTAADNTADRITLPVSQDWVQAVQDRAKADNTTVLSVLIDAAAHVIARRAGAAHDATVVVGTPTDVRDALGADAAESDGDRVSVVPCPIPVGSSLSDVAAVVRAASADRCAGLDDVIRAAGLPHIPGRSPLVDVVVTHRAGTRDLIIDGEPSVGVFVHSGAAPFDAVLSLEESEQGAQLTLEFRHAALRPTTAQRVLEEWRDAAIHPVQGTEVPDLPEVATTAQDVVRAVASHAVATPDAVAVEDGATTLTYAQLNTSAAALAEHITAQGAQPGDVVALRLSRGVGIPVALLAALRAGTPFVAIDPNHPPHDPGRGQSRADH
ncbi:MAG: AMP-binding protein [Corynebacterium durum]|nr:AMP-binding protein [Corynebacterium durum]MDO4652415.1 AMP-binding protein [Corynebacterium durum]